MKQHVVLSVARIFGDSRGVSGLFGVLYCTVLIPSVEATLSPENATEGQRISAIAGFFNLDKSVIVKITAYANNRHTYGKIWRLRTASLYPSHKRRSRTGQQGAKCRYYENLTMPKAIYKNVRCSSSSLLR